MSPVNRLLFTAPKLNVPPGSSWFAFESFVKRVIWKANSGSSSAPEVSANDCQNGVAPDEAMLWKPRPIKPEIGALSNCWVVWLTRPMFERGEYQRASSIHNVRLTEGLVHFEARELHAVLTEDTLCRAGAIRDLELLIKILERRRSCGELQHQLRTGSDGDAALTCRLKQCNPRR